MRSRISVYELARDLANELVIDIANVLARADRLALTSAVACGRANELANELASAGDLRLDGAFAHDLADDLADDIASDLANSLACDLASARTLAHTDDFANRLTSRLIIDLARANDLASDLARANDLARGRAIALTNARTPAKGLATASALARDLASANSLADNLARALMRAGAGATDFQKALHPLKPAQANSAMSPTLRAQPMRIAGRIADAAARFLPTAHRPRYRDEYHSELYELATAGASRRYQLLYAVRLIDHAFILRAELLAPAAHQARP